jgi:acyl carrier protein
VKHSRGNCSLANPEDLHDDLKKLIVDTLVLEEVTAGEIETDAPLFVEGLGLDSIDALEIAMVLEEQYGVVLDDDPDKNREVFESVRSLAAFVAEHRVK